MRKRKQLLGLLQLLRDGAYPALAAVGSGDCRPPVKDQKARRLNSKAVRSSPRVRNMPTQSSRSLDLF